MREYSEIYGLKIENYQSIDCLWLPSNGDYVEVRVDAPIGVSQEDASRGQQQMIRATKDIAGVNLETDAVDLFPIVDKIYRTLKEGIVVELAFITITASLKQEKMRRKRQCLRDELYHQGGSAAVDGQLRPFKIGVEWQAPSRATRPSFPELLINGTSRHVYQPEIGVYQAYIRKSAGLHDFDLVRGKIRKHLNFDSSHESAA
jgi:hypothetical protein